MKVYVSVDLEGITGITHWDEAEKGTPDYIEFRERMTQEARAACAGAFAAGASEVWVKDAHDTGRNLLASELPRGIRLIRSWSEGPLPMMQELDASFDAAMMVGYHAGAETGASPLEHTFPRRFTGVRLNGAPASELLLNATFAASLGVPVVLVTGDERTCEEASALNPRIRTVPVLRGVGGSTVSIHPEEAIDRIRRESEGALRDDPAACAFEVPDRFVVEIDLANHATAHRMAFYPGAVRRGARGISFDTDDVFDVKRLMLFAMLASWDAR